MGEVRWPLLLLPWTGKCKYVTLLVLLLVCNISEMHLVEGVPDPFNDGRYCPCWRQCIDFLVKLRPRKTPYNRIAKLWLGEVKLHTFQTTGTTLISDQLQDPATLSPQNDLPVPIKSEAGYAHRRHRSCDGEDKNPCHCREPNRGRPTVATKFTD
jgi:hypothetical protein